MTQGATPQSVTLQGATTSPVSGLRMFAGPNGSGKSTMQSVIRPGLLGLSINPDEIEKTLRQHGFLDLTTFGVQTSAAEIGAFFFSSTLLQNAALSAAASGLTFSGGKLEFQDVPIN